MQPPKRARAPLQLYIKECSNAETHMKPDFVGMKGNMENKLSCHRGYITITMA